jgi:hypothetical protein
LNLLPDFVRAKRRSTLRGNVLYVFLPKTHRATLFADA